MTEGTEKLPPNLKLLADLITENQPPRTADPFLDDLTEELDEIGTGLGTAGVSIGPGRPPPAPDVVARSVAGALGMVIRPGGDPGDGMEKCPTPGCGRWRTKT